MCSWPTVYPCIILAGRYCVDMCAHRRNLTALELAKLDLARTEEDLRFFKKVEGIYAYSHAQ